MFVRIVLFLIATGAFSAAAQADWSAGKILDEFDQKHRFIAISSMQEPALGFVCEAETGKMKLLYKSGEKASAFYKKRFPIWPVWTYVIVDDQPVRSFPGSLIGIDKKVAFESYDDAAVALSNIIAKAERRVLIAIQLGSEKLFRNEVAVTGSAGAINAVFQTLQQIPALKPQSAARPLEGHLQKAACLRLIAETSRFQRDSYRPVVRRPASA